MNAMRDTDEYVTPEACDRRHKESTDAFDKLFNLMSAVNNRLYVDNGRKSIQSILNDHERILCVIIWLTGVFTTVAIGGIVTGIVWLIKKVMGG